MDERTPAHQHKEILYKATEVARAALAEIAIKYGSGRDDGAVPTLRDLAYHNVQHSVRVRNAAIQLANDLKLNPLDVALTGMIAAAHDVIHEPTTETSEERSAQWLTSRMRQADFSDEDICVAVTAVIATTPLYDTSGCFKGQLFSETEFESERAYRIAFCVAAADMEAVFSAHGPKVAHDLFKERGGIGYNQTPQTLDGLAEFQRQQLLFVTNFVPLDPALESYFGDLRKPISVYNETLLRDIESGKITSWDEVVDRDVQFLREYSMDE